MIGIVWIIVQFLTGVLAASTTKSPSLTSSSPSPSNNATCPHRIINYISHALPQQCLATNRSLENQNGQNASQDLSVEVGTSKTKDFYSTTDPILNGRITASSISTTPPTVKSDLTSTEVHESISARSIVASDEPASASQTLEEDSALENGSFLSFEEWKKQNLKKVGQSEHIGSAGQADFPEPRKRPINVQNTLDSLGDDAEIDIDFTGFVSGGPGKAVHEVTHPIAEVPENEKLDLPTNARARARSKDAGTTCKERFNYASFDCAANILKTNREAKSSSAILLENKDSYMLNQCAAKDKFIILELCNDILIDTIVLANFEFFSSTFRTFRVSVSDRYPTKAEKWKTLGVYEARNTRELQAFLVENPVIWTRYVRLEFLTHYGKEFYCPISLLRVHGTTMMEEYKHDMERGVEDENEEDDQTHDEDISTVTSVNTEASPLSSESMSAREEDQLQDIPLILEHVTPEEEDMQEPRTKVQTQATVTDAVPPSVVAYEAISAVIDLSDVCVPKDSPVPTDTLQPDSSSSHSSKAAAIVSTTKQPNHTQTVAGSGEKLSPATSNASSASNVKRSMSEEISSKASKATKTSTPIPFLGTESSTISTDTAAVTRDRAPNLTGDKSRQSSTPAQPPPAVPTIQESFFKSVQKRLQMLEANSSLSLQYIEDQSRALRDAFKRVEQRQLAKTTGFLDQLNSTVLNELREFRQQYDQLWQSTVIELEIQRERYERDTEAINVRLGLLADEVIFQRRMGILQMVLILVCLVLVLFSRGSINNYLELPLVQNVLSRSPSTKWLNLSNRSTPARANRAYGAYQSRNGIVKAHRRMHSEDSITDTQSGPEAYIPLTPVSFDAQSDAEYYKEEVKSPISDFEEGDGHFDGPEFDPNLIERPSTSPPVLRINDLSPVSETHHTSDEDAHEVQLSEHVPDISLELLNGNGLAGPQSGDLLPPAKHLSWDLPTT